MIFQQLAFSYCRCSTGRRSSRGGLGPSPFQLLDMLEWTGATARAEQSPRHKPGNETSPCVGTTYTKAPADNGLICCATLMRRTAF